ncbi:hypothetical protein CTAYLR_009731 [Chrysophaeum taylorii]|uniref:Vacuolar protein sorting-associated protein 26 n=1 Tax=Chrysophaeum taylorii TaxID=2483200 RepID=A0AAD7UA33_9STRA|nr:hypothetical protein CTAYLR_009731 [Chrysophaeum taylorii]
MFGFGKASDRIAISFENEGSRTKKALSASSTQLPVFGSTESVRGQVEVRVPAGKKVEHLGVKIELIGQIEMYYDRGNFHDFTSLVRELDSPGVLLRDQRYAFDFGNVEKPYESYNGLNVRLRYFVRVTVTRNYTSGNMVKEAEFLTLLAQPPPDVNNSIKMEVGIEECLHIEFEYDKVKYHLSDIIIGKVYFLLVRIKIKHMELAIIRREAAGTGAQQYNESETVTKFEVMDGAPVRGECIPIRLFLNNYNVTPTYRNIANKFSVKYYLNLVLVDQEERRYFKQQEITLYRAAAA